MDLELEKQVRALIDQDQKIEAIKLVRRITGWRLRESKDYVDALARAALPALSPADEAALEREVKTLQRQVTGVCLDQQRTTLERPGMRSNAGALEREKNGRKAVLQKIFCARSQEF